MAGTAPLELPLGPGERRLMNIWLPGRTAEGGLVPASLFPVLDTTAASIRRNVQGNASDTTVDSLQVGSLPYSE